MKILLMLITLVISAGYGYAQETGFGPVTSLPIPRYVSIKAAEANVRRGPSLSHRIDWIYKRRHLPVQITAEYGHWRRIQDMEGAGGWVHYSLLSGARYVVITGKTVPFFRKPREDDNAIAMAEAGVVARLGDCNADWCKLTADGYSGWARKSKLWGVLPNELRD